MTSIVQCPPPAPPQWETLSLSKCFLAALHGSGRQFLPESERNQFFLELSILLKLGLIFFAETKWKGVFQQLSAFAEKVGANWSEKGRDVYSLVRSIFSPTIFFLNLFFHENKLGLSWAKLSSIWDWT